MTVTDKVFENEEKAIFRLRALYAAYGFSKYKMSKFEEYDFYVRNKDFLVSDNIITFTDSDGKLMALKPDVTLSIIKSSKDIKGFVQKMYYNENVYRASGDTGQVKEIMQVGLECIGDIDNYSIAEVVLLAAKSLECIDSDYVLDISHMGIIADALEASGLSLDGCSAALNAFGEKNIQAIEEICHSEKIENDKTELLLGLSSLSGIPSEVLPKLKSLSVSDKFMSAVGQLEEISQMLRANGCEERTRIDFSVANNMKYYSGVAFKGFINGIPGGVLSGGEYDKLMKKLGRSSGAVGFAVYLDMLNWIEKATDEFDVDTLLIYDDMTETSDIGNAVRELAKDGKSVMAQRSIPNKIRYRQLARLGKGEVKILENIYA